MRVLERSVLGTHRKLGAMKWSRMTLRCCLIYYCRAEVFLRPYWQLRRIDLSGVSSQINTNLGHDTGGLVIQALEGLPRERPTRDPFS